VGIILSGLKALMINNLWKLFNF